jgi:hypothetical protein
LSHTYSVSTAAFAAGGDVIGAELEKGMIYYPYSGRTPQGYTEGGLGISAELSGGAMSQVSAPLFVWNKPANTRLALAQPQFTSSYQIPRNNFSSSNSRFNFAQFSSTGATQTSPSLGQVLAGLQAALQQLSSVLSSLKK